MQKPTKSPILWSRKSEDFLGIWRIFKHKMSFEIRRALAHIVLGVAILCIAYLFDEAKWILFFALIFGLFLSLASLKFKIPVIHFFIEKFEKRQYLKTFPGKGILFFVAGCLIVLKLFSLQIALASIAILTFGDSVSHLIGLIGRRQSFLDPTKNIEGTIAGILAATIFASFFIPLLYALIASVVAMLAETISFKLEGDNVDDNLIIPLVAGTILYLFV